MVRSFLFHLVVVFTILISSLNYGIEDQCFTKKANNLNNVRNVGSGCPVYDMVWSPDFDFYSSKDFKNDEFSSLSLESFNYLSFIFFEKPNNKQYLSKFLFFESGVSPPIC